MSRTSEHLHRSSPKLEVISAFNTGVAALQYEILDLTNSQMILGKTVEGDRAINRLRHELGVVKAGIKKSTGEEKPLTAASEIEHAMDPYEYKRKGTLVEFPDEGISVTPLIYSLRRLSAKNVALSNQIGELGGGSRNRLSVGMEGYKLNQIAGILLENSRPFPIEKGDTDLWQARVELEAGRYVHNNGQIDSDLMDPEAHRNADWSYAEASLVARRLLTLPPEEAVVVDSGTRKRWFAGCVPTASSLILAGGIGVALFFSDCNPLINPASGRPEASPTAQVATKPASPQVGIVQGVPTVEIKPTPDAYEGSTVYEACPEPTGMDVYITEIVRAGDADANREYYFPNRVNQAGDSIKGLFEKELAALYAKENPYSDEAIRFNQKNQPNQGRNVLPSDEDLDLLADEAKLYYGEAIVDAALLSFKSSVLRNNQFQVLDKNGDTILVERFVSQDPATIVKQLQEIQKNK